MSERKKAELLSPAGSFEKLRAAVLYGADAVYLAAKRFGMRAASDNFTRAELAGAVAYCHERGVKLSVTVNVPSSPKSMELPERYFICPMLRIPFLARTV